MPILTADMRRVVTQQRLAYVATVCPDGTPNLSPKGTLTVWDDDHLIFADIRSPRTIGNLRANSACEVNVVDPIARKGYRFKGRAEVIGDGPDFERMVAFFRQRGTTSAIRHVVLIAVERALPLISPGYDGGASEDEIRARWRRYYAGLREEGTADDAPSDWRHALRAAMRGTVLQARPLNAFASIDASRRSGGILLATGPSAAG